MSNKQASLENPKLRKDCHENDDVWEVFSEGGVKECCWDGRGAWFIELQLSNMWEKSSKNAVVSELKSSKKEMGLVGSEPLGYMQRKISQLQIVAKRPGVVRTKLHNPVIEEQ